MEAIQTPYDLQLLGVIERATPKMERDLHRQFEEDRLRGEWFRPSPELLRYISRPPVSRPKLPGKYKTYNYDEPPAREANQNDYWEYAIERVRERERREDMEPARLFFRDCE